jgi:hypothetical protein
MLLGESAMFIGILAWIPDQVRDDAPKTVVFQQPLIPGCSIDPIRDVL